MKSLIQSLQNSIPRCEPWCWNILTYIETPKITQSCRWIYQHHGSHLGYTQGQIIIDVLFYLFLVARCFRFDQVDQQQLLHVSHSLQFHSKISRAVKLSFSSISTPLWCLRQGFKTYASHIVDPVNEGEISIQIKARKKRSGLLFHFSDVEQSRAYSIPCLKPQTN